MARLNAIFHIDFVNGSDAARTALTSVSFANNGSGAVRATKTAHGLTQGACVTVGSGTYAGEWLINYIDANNFDLCGGKAIGAVIINGTPAIDDTLTIAGTVFTFKSARGGAGEVTISSDAETMIANLCNAINSDMTTITSGQQPNGVKFYSIINGTVGNAYTLSATGAALFVSGATLTGGANSTYSAASTGITVTPFGGSSWGDAWLTITSGATAARIAPGDTIRMSKTADPESIGNATWTDLSKTVALASAQTLNVNLCETAWTASTNVTCNTSTIRKQGSNAVSIAIATAFTTGKVAYQGLGSTVDFSAYQKLSFWIRNSAAVAASALRVCLCSDTAGATVVDSFVVPAIPSTARYVPFTIARTGGGNLGNAIQSVALYADSDPGTPTILLDNIIACTTSGLSLTSLITKNGAAQGGSEGVFGIQSINGTTVLLDNDTETLATAGLGYSGVTETVASYKREGFRTTLASSSSSAVHTINDSGYASGYIEFCGGWNTTTSLQDSDTLFEGGNGNGYGIFLSTKNYIKLSRLAVVRFNYGIVLNNSTYNTIWSIGNANNNVSSIYISGSSNNTIWSIGNVNNNAGNGVTISSSNNTIWRIGNVNNNTTSAVYFYTANNNAIWSIGNVNNNAGNGVTFSLSNNNIVKILSSTGGTGISSDAGVNYLRESVFNQSTEFTSTAFPVNNWVHSKNHDNVQGNDWSFTYLATVNWQTVFKWGSSAGSRKMTITGSGRSTDYPVRYKLANIYFTGGSAITVKAMVMKEHATNVGARLLVMRDDYPGIAETATVAADNTNWQELSLTLNATATAVSGKKLVAELWIECWFVAAAGNIYFYPLV